MLVIERESKNTTRKLDTCSQAVIKTLLYFDIFNFPLTISEINFYCPVELSLPEIKTSLLLLEEKGHIKRNDLFYTLSHNNIDFLSTRRVEGEIKAKKLLKIARRMSKFISYFPFVEAIALSGSLSKGYADKDSDIDYFIITTPGRLWLCRTLLILFKKIFLFNSHKFFCVNYLVDSKSLTISDENEFTAIEFATLIPTYNSALYAELIQSNGWVKRILPNFEMRNTHKIIAVNKSGVKKLLELPFKGKLGAKLDDWCFRLTVSQWRKKFPSFSTEQFEHRLRSKKNISKHHPLGFQEKVLQAYQERIQFFEKRNNCEIE